MKKQYWAVGLNFDYEVMAEKPRSEDWGNVEGPFDTLKEAKEHVRYWIKTDRWHLASQLKSLNETKAWEL